MTLSTYNPPSLRSCLVIQGRVIGALVLRELHTRFGRNNIGYLWMFVEPALLSAAITTFHLAIHASTSLGMDVAPFYLTGYTPFLCFRTTVGRASATIESNRSLLYHRYITIFDLLTARAILDAASSTVPLFALLGLCAAVGLGELPARPHLMFLGLGLFYWLCFALSLCVCALAEGSTATEKLVHPVTYILMPLSGVFWLVETIPEPYRSIILLFPMVHFLELVREGQFASFDSPFIDLPYAIAWCVGLTIIGLLALRAVRPHVVIE
jgi:capsular polysaccharide transport system permease protein